MLVSKQLETLFLDILCLTSYRSHGEMETQFLVFPSIQTCFSLLLTQRHRTEVNLAESWPKYTPNPHICNTEKERQFPYVYGHYLSILAASFLYF